MNDQIFRALCAEIGAGKVPRPIDMRADLNWFLAIWSGARVVGNGPDVYFIFGSKQCPSTIDIRDVAHLHELLEKIK